MLKEFIPFIDKDRYLTIQLFEFLASQKKTVHTFFEIQEALQVSQYRVKITIHDAINLSKDFPTFKLTFENDILSAFNINNSLLNKIIDFEAHKSLSFRIFLHTTLNIYSESDTEFQRNVGISPSTYFRLKKGLYQDIGSSKIECIKKSEVFARYYIYQVLVYFSYFDYFPKCIKDSKKFIKMKNSIAYCSLIWKITPTESQRKQINYFVAIGILRSKNQHHIPENDNKYLVEVLSHEQVLLFMKHLSKDWYLLEKNALLVTRYALTFLISINNLPVSQLGFLKNFGEIQSVTNQQVDIIKDLAGTSLVDTDIMDCQNKLLKANARILSPFFKTDLFFTEQHWHYANLLRNGAVENLIDEFTSLIGSVNSTPFNKQEIAQIKKDYALIILPKLSIHNLILPVHIVIDFSEGNLFNDYIASGIQSIAGLNIKIDQHLSSLTDIYLTDTFNPSYTKQQIIWPAMPQKSDWQQLKAYIMDLQKNRFNKLDKTIDYGE
ncbi:hypothetical protein AB5N10_00905 [Weissella paramesenteroides]|uniref:hypothetical protein n=1 Tax=Weissella paramesenteroides TaxID=1249 RepID=UPI001C1F4202|nr:hypothetical protein [Weissella paramesenteroides]MBU7556777.1 hypothetical protein [Weissella paramesenteroides]